VSGPAVRRSLADSTRRLLFLGGPLPLRLAVSSYRAAGSGGYSMLRGARVVWRSGREVRDLMVEYFSERGRLPASADGNWRLVPPRAVETLAREEAAAR
jgi:2',3'-cyclic-nucleotide 2'-phosphodiesterase/3'-nucleotidase